MFLDASVLVSIFNNEDGCEELQQRITDSQLPCYVSPIVMFEASLAIARSSWEITKGKGPSRAELIVQARSALEDYLAAIEVLEVPITSQIGSAAIDAAAIYGKAVGHRAALNMGDCFSYACAKAVNASLLYKGNDFSETDLA